MARVSNVTADKEPWICEYCNKINLMGRKEFHRREVKNRMIKMDDITFRNLRNFCNGFPNKNVGIMMMLRRINDIDKETEMLEQRKLREGIQVEYGDRGQ